LTEGQIVTVGQLTLTVIHTPGHSPGGVCFYAKEEKVLISGDTLFRGTIGKLNSPTGQAERMWPSLKKLAALPPDVRVYPGHGEGTSIGEENWLARAEEIFNE
jgi:hydroxyacylglutathione hydrolase